MNLKIRIVMSAAALVLTLVPTAQASPDAPESPPVVVGHFDFINEFPGDTSLCGFPVDWMVHSQGSFRFFPTRQGHDFTNVAVGQVNYTFTANGKTIVARVRLGETFFPNKAYPELTDVLTMHGLSIQIRLLGGGIVIQDAGLVVELPDGTVGIVRGPHPVLQSGGLSFAVATICGKLA